MSNSLIAIRRARLRLLSVVLPLAGLATLYAVRVAMLRGWPISAVDAVSGALLFAGVLGCSLAVFNVIDRQDRALAEQHHELLQRYEMEHRMRAQTETLHQAALAVASARTPDQTLQHLTDLARDLIGARYAVLSVLDREGAIDDFYTSGITEEERARAGRSPQDHDILADLLSSVAAPGKPDIPSDPIVVARSSRLQPIYYKIEIPVVHREHAVGNLSLARSVGTIEFSAEDQHMLGLVASHAAVVIQNARLTEQVRQLAVVAERRRIATEFHDGMIQVIYAANLDLEDAAEDVERDPEAVRRRLDLVIERLGAVTQDIRAAILGLNSSLPASEMPTSKLSGE